MTVLDLSTLVLAVGPHNTGDQFCLLEAAAFQAGEPWSDHPTCVSPILGAYGRSLNDTLPYETRQRLVPLIPRLLNTAGDGLDERRSYMALDWLTRTYLPAWLRLVPALTTQADLLAAAHEVVDLDTAAAIGVLVREAASQANATWATAWAANGPAWAAVWAAWAATGPATWDAAGDAARDAAWATQSAARDAAGPAARSAARTAAGPATGPDAGPDAEAFFAPTVTALQYSTIDLFDRMLTVTK